MSSAGRVARGSPVRWMAREARPIWGGAVELDPVSSASLDRDLAAAGETFGAGAGAGAGADDSVTARIEQAERCYKCLESAMNLGGVEVVCPKCYHKLIILFEYLSTGRTVPAELGRVPCFDEALNDQR